MNLIVYLSGTKAGVLSQSGRFLKFSYLKAYLSQENPIPLSLSLPLKNEEFDDSISRAFFAGLIPESNIQKDMAKLSHLSEKNLFGFLEKYGGECAGAISLWPENSKPNFKGNYEEIKTSEWRQWVDSHKPLLAISKEIRLSLAGAQQKLPVFFNGKKFYLPKKGAVSTHIVKPSIAYLDSSAENEFFCMNLARISGLFVPDTFLLNSPPTRPDQKRFSLYVVSRYDRFKKNGDYFRLHQEDFCQASSILPENKYESEGGLSLKMAFDLVSKNSTNPVADRLQLLHLVVFNYLIGNADAHGKNVSWLVDENGFHLAPFYDLISTEIYPDLTKKHAMKIGGENRGDWISKRHWERFAAEINMKPAFVLETISEFASQVGQAINNFSDKFIKKYGAEKIIRHLQKIIEKRVKTLTSG